MPASRITATMGAHAADLDHRRPRREAGGTRRRLELRGDLRRGRLADRAALIAQQERRQIVTPDWGQTLAPLNAARLRDRHGIGRAAGVIMTGGRKDRLLR